MFKKNAIAAAVAFSAAVAGDLALAEDRQVHALRGDDFVLDEVLVTARKRVENLQSVPIAVDAFTEQQLEEKAITSLADVAKYSPSLTFEQGVLPNDTRPTIRGMNISRGRPNVAILVDGIDVSSETLTVAGGGAFVNMGLMDLERIEVIKGPQSVTYGRSAFAGAVNYITKRPDASEGFNGYIEAEVNDYGYLKGQGGASFAIVPDVLAAGLTFTTSDFDGYYENPNTGGDLGGVEQDGVAFSLNFTPEGMFSAYFRAEYSEDSYTPRAIAVSPSLSNASAPGDFFLSGSLGKGAVNTPIPGGIRGVPEPTAEQCAGSMSFAYLFGQPIACASMLMGEVDTLGESDIDQSPNPLTGKDFDGTSIENLRTSLELAWSLDSIDIVSLTAYSDNETSVSEDFDLTNFDLESLGPGSANFDPQYAFANPFGPFPDFTPLGNDPTAAMTQFGVNTNSDTSFEYQQFSQEIRISGDVGNLEWMLDGLYWEEEMDAVMNQMWWARESMDATYWDSILSRFADPTCAVPGKVDTCMLFSGIQTEMTPLPIPMSRDTDHWSIAASFTYNFTDALRMTVEGRYLEETLEYESLPLDTFINGFLNMPYFDPVTFSFVPEVQKRSLDYDAFVPRVSVDWQANDDVFLYASVGEGFKPGGIATTDGNGDISTGEYEPEELLAYEIGFKTDLLENRLRLNAAAFYNDYTDQQVPFFVTSMAGVSNVSVTNAGKSEVIGAEMEAIYRPSANWTFRLAYTHNETEYKEFSISDVGVPGTYDKVQSGNPEGDFAGKAFTNTPEDLMILSIRYDGQFNNGWHYFTELFGSYESKEYMDAGNLSYLPEVWLADFSAGLSSDKWQVTAYVNNLTDEDRAQSGLGNVSYGFMPAGQVPPFSVSQILRDPRTFGIRARFRF
ncbi:TonB-dependent receptor [Parahaliea maris]|uniref:TonB-dependent receptor n=1 Tax=Parahaliea maris TaxID=2716870 RepID=A0A5C9A640_9GAMM|nr:TonB-dependent receptor [Parahaliea maris]TXS96403.1 TonB-dependent receptor [Parahaliea maris]